MTAPHRMAPHEAALLARAAARADWSTLGTLRGDTMRHVAETEGHDFAAALFFDRVRRSPRHRPFIDSAEASNHTDTPALNGLTITLVPGALHRSHPETGADGRRVAEVAERLGVPIERVDLPDFAPAAVNVRRVIEHLARRPKASQTVVVSLSKGSLDVARALREPDAVAAFSDVAAWVDLSGVPDGSREIDWLLARPWWRWALRGVCLVNRFDFSAVSEMAFHGPRAQDVPRRPFTVRVVGVPLERHLSGRRARRAYRRLAPLGPTDGGGVLLADLVDCPDVVYPIWGADHYLRPPWDITDVVARIVGRAAAGASAERELMAPQTCAPDAEDTMTP